MDKKIIYPYDPKEGDTKFVLVLKQIMREDNYSQSELAKWLGVRQSQISNWLNGRSMPGYHSLQLLKNKLDTNITHYFE